MRIVSVNVGTPRLVEWRGRAVSTGIWKAPVEGEVPVRGHNLAGDGQADLEVHGGPDKAVYAYAHSHYGWWLAELGLDALPCGAFGENLTIDEFSEADIRIGDEYRAGTARLRVTQPRMPCFKLGIRFDRPDMPDRFLASGRSGFYLAIIEDGAVRAGDPVTRLHRESSSITVAEAAHLYAGRDLDAALLRRGIETPGLPEGWRRRFRERLEKLQPEARTSGE